MAAAVAVAAAAAAAAARMARAVGTTTNMGQAWLVKTGGTTLASLAVAEAARAATQVCIR